MIRLILCTIIIYLVHNTLGQSGGISSKLNFGGDESTTIDYESTLSTSLVKALVSLRQSSGASKTIISSKLDQNPFNLKNIAPLARSTGINNDFSSLDVICVNGQCNTTDSNSNLNSNKGDKLSTDIVVQVVTNVKDNNNKTSATGEDSDVPVVVGYSGTSVKNSDFDLTNRQIENSDDVKIQTSGNTDKNYNFYQIGNEVKPTDDSYSHQIPYFNPNYNNHYFGELPPPQFVWFRRRNGHPSSNNPHAFLVNNRPYKPWQWQLKYPSATVTPSGWTTTTQCACANPGLNWYPNFGPNQPTPNPSVNNKMAPLA